MRNSPASTDREDSRVANHLSEHRNRHSNPSSARGSHPVDRLLARPHGRGDRPDRINRSRGSDKGLNREFNRLLSRADSPRPGGANRGELDRIPNARRGRPSRYRLSGN